ncbi:hypothetical protein [Solidesulfovibrio fructosivorans]|uniref:hypothetical protein n=1 Tax=Solidesulfovibrio fructosivorans TaxID=878 RepID=UPI00117C3E85|nr:hypothetical protein [Solidesulfovibrio fructosivorans]
MDDNVFELPDMFLIVGSEIIDGDSFQNLSQNANDAATFLYKRGRIKRQEGVSRFVEAMKKRLR